MEKRRMVKTCFMLGFAAVIAIGAMVAMAGDEKMMKLDEGSMMKCPAKDMQQCNMKDMQKCNMNCMKCCDKNMKDTSEAIALLDEAVKAIDAGDTADAKIKIEKAKGMLAEIKMQQEKCMQQMPVINAVCPIMGNKVDMMNAPKELTRMYKGKKVGFCCTNCPLKWDALTDAEKDQKLKECMPKPEDAPKMPDNMKEETKEKIRNMMKEKGEHQMMH